MIITVSGFAVSGIGGLQGPEQMPDFREYEAGKVRKTEFFDFLQPLIEAENRAVLADRRRLEELAARSARSWLDRWWLERLAGEYGIDVEDIGDAELIDELLRRVNVVPVSLALAQAAKESGWGTSRFAREGNNLFGEWCFEPGCGIVPSKRAADAKHEVETFESVRASVRSYVRNLNTHRSYESFRRERARLSKADRPLSGLTLADTLVAYSERRSDYVEEIKGLIRFNDLPERAGSDNEA